MKNCTTQLLLWAIGFGLFGGAIYLVGSDTLLFQVGKLKWVDIAAWVALTLMLRILMSETLVLPLRRIGVFLHREKAFWLGWLRTFFNQLIPVSGLAYAAAYLRRDTTLAWSEIASVGAPQVLLAMQAASGLGLIMGIFNLERLGNAAAPVMTGFICLGSFSLAVPFWLEYALERLPINIRIKFTEGIAALRIYRQSRVMTWQVLGAHAGIIVLRGLRLWALCIGAGLAVPVEVALLLAVLSSLVLLAQLTPGGLGLMEGAVVGGGILVGLDPVAIGAVAIIDRTLTVIAVLLMSPISFWRLYREN